MKTFGEIYKLWNLIKEPACFKNPEIPTYIDLILPHSFKNVIDTGLSDFHKMIEAVMKMHFSKIKSHVVSYRKYKGHSQRNFLRLIKAWV